MANYVQMISPPGSIQYKINSDLLTLCTFEEAMRAADSTIGQASIIYLSDITGTVYIVGIEGEDGPWFRINTTLVGSTSDKPIYLHTKFMIFRGYTKALEEVVY